MEQKIQGTTKPTPQMSDKKIAKFNPKENLYRIAAANPGKIQF